MKQHPSSSNLKSSIRNQCFFFAFNSRVHIEKQLKKNNNNKKLTMYILVMLFSWKVLHLKNTCEFNAYE